LEWRDRSPRPPEAERPRSDQESFARSVPEFAYFRKENVMRNIPYSGRVRPLKVSSESEAVLAFLRLECVPCPEGQRSVRLKNVDVTMQMLDFIDLGDGSRRPAPPILIGPIGLIREIDALVATLGPRLTAITAIDAVAGDDDGPNAIPKGVVCAMVFGVAISDAAEADFEAWRNCGQNLKAWHQARFRRARSNRQTQFETARDRSRGDLTTLQEPSPCPRTRTISSSTISAVASRCRTGRLW